VLGILGGTLVSASNNQRTCIVEDVHLPAAPPLAYLRVVSVMGEGSFANAAAMVRVGTGEREAMRTLFAWDARELSYVMSPAMARAGNKKG
jgi:hypothetical protein